ncbi:MAG: DUF4296 domain-containing protein [Bacteroidales bacterium]|jgi:hypothetical protein|nr:DUF4296 domain-containing protein [Bacteroidales bacterium]
MRYKKYIFVGILLAIFCCGGCRQSEVKKPDNLLEMTVVENILLDLHLTEATVRVKMFNQNEIDMNKWQKNEIVDLFKKYNTDYQQFEKSLNYYMSDKKKSKKIIDNIVNRLVKMQAKKNDNKKS